MTFDEAEHWIKRGDILSLRRELEKGDSPNLANRQSWTLLMLAAMTGNTAVGELLVSKAADVNATNDFGETAFSLAAHFGHIPFMELLLENGASLDCRPHGQELGHWLTVASGLEREKLRKVIALIGG
jgi:ankyrin repeat protein